MKIPPAYGTFPLISQCSSLARVVPLSLPGICDKLLKDKLFFFFLPPPVTSFLSCREITHSQESTPGLPRPATLKPTPTAGKAQPLRPSLACKWPWQVIVKRRVGLMNNRSLCASGKRRRKCGPLTRGSSLAPPSLALSPLGIPRRLSRSSDSLI